MKHFAKFFLTGAFIFLFVSGLLAQAPDTLWTKTFGGSDNDHGYSVQQTNDNGYIIAGTTWSFGAGYTDIYLIKTDSLGGTLWTKTFGDTLHDYGSSVQQTRPDNGYIITGSYYYGAGQNDVWLIKTDSLGNMSWDKTFGGGNSDGGYSVEQTNDKGYIIAGYTWSGAGGSDVYLIKTDSLGGTLWTKTFGDTLNDYGYSVQQTRPDNGYIIAGRTYSYGAGASDVWLIKTDSSGNMSWDKTFGGTDYDGGNSVQQTNDNGYIIAGATGSYGAGNSDVYLIKTGPESGVQETPKARQKTELELQNYPNPFVSNTNIGFNIPKKTPVSLKIYNLAGQLERILIDSELKAGKHQISWDGRNTGGKEMKAGIYFIKFNGNYVGKVIKF